MNYKGISFPFRFENGRVATSELSLTNYKRIVEAIKQIILTNPNERVMLANFGCNIKRFVFENDDFFDALIKRIVQDELTEWENRVEIKSIDVLRRDEGIILEISFLRPDFVEEKTEVFYGYL